ncbi:hypothetical protein VNO77_23444 [Canavalia gladiata]|uniref:Uncharacterized protein n=1 Tax=Canavalia gladiata TaxID=3824 RepID=A0AAN9L7U1_CANGL
MPTVRTSGTRMGLCIGRCSNVVLALGRLYVVLVGSSLHQQHPWRLPARILTRLSITVAGNVKDVVHTATSSFMLLVRPRLGRERPSSQQTDWYKVFGSLRQRSGRMARKEPCNSLIIGYSTPIGLKNSLRLHSERLCTLGLGSKNCQGSHAALIKTCSEKQNPCKVGISTWDEIHANGGTR